MWTKALFDVSLLGFEVLGPIATREFGPAGHGAISRRANELEDAMALIDVGLAFEDWLALKHLAEDAAVIKLVSLLRSLCVAELTQHPTDQSQVYISSK